MTEMSEYSLDDLTRLFRTKTTICDCDGCTTAAEPCWLFARVDRYGYGSFKFRGRNVVAHRYSYEQLVGDLDPALTIDHLCDRHRNCVNPAHMEQVTRSENSVRANERRYNREQGFYSRGDDSVVNEDE